MAVIAIQNAKDGIADVTLTAASAGGDTIVGGGTGGGHTMGVILVVRNAHTAAQTVTVLGHPPVAVAANTGTAIIPIGGVYAGQAKAVTYSSVTALTIGAVRLTGLA